MLGWGLAATVGFIAAALIAPSLFLIAADDGVGRDLCARGRDARRLGFACRRDRRRACGRRRRKPVRTTFVGFIGTDLKVGVPFALMAIILLARPQGLFGTSAVIRA